MFVEAYFAAAMETVEVAASVRPSRLAAFPYRDTSRRRRRFDGNSIGIRADRVRIRGSRAWRRKSSRGAGGRVGWCGGIGFQDRSWRRRRFIWKLVEIDVSGCLKH